MSYLLFENAAEGTTKVPSTNDPIGTLYKVKGMTGSYKKYSNTLTKMSDGRTSIVQISLISPNPNSKPFKKDIRLLSFDTPTQAAQQTQRPLGQPQQGVQNIPNVQQVNTNTQQQNAPMQPDKEGFQSLGVKSLMLTKDLPEEENIKFYIEKKGDVESLDTYLDPKTNKKYVTIGVTKVNGKDEPVRVPAGDYFAVVDIFKATGEDNMETNAIGMPSASTVKKTALMAAGSLIPAFGAIYVYSKFLGGGKIDMKNWKYLAIFGAVALIGGIATSKLANIKVPIINDNVDNAW